MFKRSALLSSLARVFNFIEAESPVFEISDGLSAFASYFKNERKLNCTNNLQKELSDYGAAQWCSG